MLINAFVVGFASSVVPMYLTEISPAAIKGAMGVVLPLGLTCGILIAQVLGQAELLGTASSWPILLSFPAAFIVIGLIAFVYAPESPTFLYVIREDEKEAIAGKRALLMQCA